MTARQLFICLSLCTHAVLQAQDALPVKTEPAGDPRVHPTSADGSQSKLKAFVEEDYLLAYDVLIGSGDVATAMRLAQRAVEARPGSATWRRRLAQAAEWNQQPQIAVAQWEWLFGRGDQSPDTVQALIRLAPLVQDPQIAIRAWQIQIRKGAVSNRQWGDIYDLYEAAGLAREGSAFFEAQYRIRRDAGLLEYAARLADNAGEDTRAIALYQERMGLAPFSLEVTLRTVLMLTRRDRLEEALTLMQKARPQVPEDAAEFWNLLGQLAWEARQSDLAREAYERYTRSPQATSGDWSRLITLVRPQYPRQAAELAFQAFRRYGQLDQLLFTLGLYAELAENSAQGQIFNELTPKELETAERNSQFLILRAQYHQRQKANDRASADFQLALQINPDDMEVILANLWFLIDTQNKEALARLMQSKLLTARVNSSYWLAYAAGSQILERHREAVRWYQKALRRDSKDPLVLLNYADALERVRRPGMAERVRRHAWLQLQDLRRSQPKASTSLAQQPQLLATARLALLNQPGDASLSRVRQLVERLRDSPGGSETEAESLEDLLLGWTLTKDRFESARSWMWTRYARQARAAPIWARSQVALQLQDTRELQTLLNDQRTNLPVYTLYDTAYALGHAGQALTTAFDGMVRQPDDEALHDRYRQHAPLHRNYLQSEVFSDALGTLQRQGIQWEGRLALSPRMHLLVGGLRVSQSSTDTVLGPLTPGADQLDRVEARWMSMRGETSVTLQRGLEFQTTTGLRVRHTTRTGGRISWDAGLDFRVPSLTSLPLRVAGYENAVYGSMQYNLGNREYLRIAPRFTQYATQMDDYLGSGRILDLEAGYRLRSNYPDWRLRAIVNHQNYSYDGGLSAASQARLPPEVQQAIVNGTVDPVGYFIPQGNTTWGACVTMGDNVAGQNLQSVYTRRWRPFLDLCLRHNTVSGDGYTSALGIAGTLAGSDHLSLLLQNSDLAVPGSAATRSIVLRYRHYF